MSRNEQTQRRTAKVPTPTGIAFSIAELLQAQSWAQVHNRPMRIRLDHAVDGEEYEEVIELRPWSGSQARLIIWRSARAVFVQPLPGKRQRFSSLDAALQSLASWQHTVLVTDITASTWPAE